MPVRKEKRSLVTIFLTSSVKRKERRRSAAGRGNTLEWLVALVEHNEAFGAPGTGGEACAFEAQKHAGDLLEKKFQEAVKKAKESPDTGRPIRDFDLD